MLSNKQQVHKMEHIYYSNLISWIRRTIVADQKRYKRSARPFSLQRVWHIISPNLREPIFILGSPRSGTTFLGSCIAELPEVSYHFEPIATKAAAKYVYESSWRFGKSKWFYRAVYSWLTRIYGDSDLRFAEKTPRNCFLVNFLSQTFPEAKFVHIIRDGRDAALSHSKKPWMQSAHAVSGKREPGGYRYGPYARFWVERERVSEFESTSDIHRCIWAWRRHTQSVLESASHLPKTRYYELRYENLINSSAHEADQLLDFLDISSFSSRSSFHKAVSTVRPDSVGLWKKELSPEQLHCIKEESGQLLQELEYT